MPTLRFALRIARSSPGATIVATLTIALAVGLTTALYSVLQAVVLNALPYSHPEQLVSLSEDGQRDSARGFVDSRTAEQWRERGRYLASLTQYQDSQGTFVDGARAEIIRGMRVSAEFFDTLGVSMALGRGFHPEDDRPRLARVMILTDAFWRARFGADPEIVGRTIVVNGERVQIIGVLPAAFEPLRMTNQAEIPQYFAPLGSEGSPRVVARLAPSATIAQVQGDLDAITRDLVLRFPRDYPATSSVRVTPLAQQVVGSTRRALWVLFGAVVLVLLVASLNLAALQLARISRRAEEFAVRSAIGADRRRLLMQVFTEHAVLATLGGAAGVAVAIGALRAIVAWAPRELPRLNEIHLDARVLAFGLGVTTVTGLVCGIAPAWFASRVDVQDTLNGAGDRGGRRSSRRARMLLVVADLALAFVLVAATGLLDRTLRNLERLSWGFRSDHVLTLTPSLAGHPRDNELAVRVAYFRELVDRVRAVPGVVAAGLVSNVPLSHLEPWPLEVEGMAGLSGTEPPMVDVFIATPGYFDALRIPLMRGRLFTDREGAEEPAAAVISASVAAREFGGADPIGRRIRVAVPVGERPDPWMSVVGVVGDVREDRLDEAAREAIYVPFASNPFHYTRLAARTTGDPRAFEGAIREAIRRIDPMQAVFHVQPMDDYVDASLADRRFTFALVSLFAAMALILAAIGIFGVVAGSVSERRHELGVRAALGAGPQRLFVLVLKESALTAALGLTAGVALAGISTRVLQALLYGVSPLDPLTLTFAAGALAIVVLLACAIPARAAARVEAMIAIRSR